MIFFNSEGALVVFSYLYECDLRTNVGASEGFLPATSKFFPNI